MNMEEPTREQLDAWLEANCGKGLPYGDATDLPSVLHGLAYILRQIEGTSSYNPHIGQCNSATSALRWTLDYFARTALAVEPSRDRAGDIIGKRLSTGSLAVEGKHVNFATDQAKQAGVTRVWSVKTKILNAGLGRVVWHKSQERYVFYPESDRDVLFDADCLQEIAAFARDITFAEGGTAPAVAGEVCRTVDNALRNALLASTETIEVLAQPPTETSEANMSIDNGTRDIILHVLDVAANYATAESAGGEFSESHRRDLAAMNGDVIAEARKLLAEGLADKQGERAVVSREVDNALRSALVSSTTLVAMCASVASETAIPAGMVHWDGGDSAPADWDGGRCAYNGYPGQIGTVSGRDSKAWRADCPHRVIAYTRKA